MYYYEYKDNLLVSIQQLNEYKELEQNEAKSLLHSTSHRTPIFLHSRNPEASRCNYYTMNPDKVFPTAEDLSLLDATVPESKTMLLPQWLSDVVKMYGAKAINTNFPGWESNISQSEPKQWRVHIAGLGDVGSMVVTGLRLIGGASISSLGVFDLDSNKVQRHILECNQILSSFGERIFPKVVALTQENIFDCDMFVFCVTAGVPPIGQEQTDVRLAQYRSNAKIVSHYARMARAAKFNGLFSVVSDPVDQLCKAALTASNVDKNGSYDGNGLLPDQIRGYGLGVMNARAAYYASCDNLAPYYQTEGRAFGPHGDGLIIADSINSYNHERSLLLTKQAKNANLEVRALGFKPYIAPALSSAALSILDTITGSWHYSSNFLGHAFMGAKNRLTPNGTEFEACALPPILKERLIETYERLCDFNE